MRGLSSAVRLPLIDGQQYQSRDKGTSRTPLLIRVQGFMGARCRAGARGVAPALPFGVDEIALILGNAPRLVLHNEDMRRMIFVISTATTVGLVVAIGAS